MIGWDPCIKKRVNYLNWIEGKCGLKDITVIEQYAALFADLLQNLFLWKLKLPPNPKVLHLLLYPEIISYMKQYN